MQYFTPMFLSAYLVVGVFGHQTHYHTYRSFKSQQSAVEKVEDPCGPLCLQQFYLATCQKSPDTKNGSRLTSEYDTTNCGTNLDILRLKRDYKHKFCHLTVGCNGGSVTLKAASDYHLLGSGTNEWEIECKNNIWYLAITTTALIDAGCDQQLLEDKEPRMKKA